ncbi:MAG: DUF4364 family protein [Clostridia bacterium]|nr:DUF4364 family protein [Clostridia bacterium]
MTETLQAPLREMSDIKIFILFLMDGIGRPMDFIEINDIVIQNGVVRPFDFCVAFPDLLETGHILMEETPAGERYSVTDIGREAAHSLGGKLLHTTMDKALQNAILLLNLRRTGAGYRYTIEALPSGKFVFHLHYTENGTDTVSLSVVTNTAKDAENMEIEFEQHPELFRRALLSLLTNSAAPIDEYEPYRLIP